MDLLIAMVHKINAHAERRVVDELVADLKRVSGKENILFRITESAVGTPERGGAPKWCSRPPVARAR